jgi:hypothetical protein
VALNKSPDVTITSKKLQTQVVGVGVTVGVTVAVAAIVGVSVGVTVGVTVIVGVGVGEGHGAIVSQLTQLLKMLNDGMNVVPAPPT